MRTVSIMCNMILEKYKLLASLYEIFTLFVYLTLGLLAILIINVPDWFQQTTIITLTTEGFCCIYCIIRFSTYPNLPKLYEHFNIIRTFVMVSFSVIITVFFSANNS